MNILFSQTGKRKDTFRKDTFHKDSQQDLKSKQKGFLVYYKGTEILS